MSDKINQGPVTTTTRATDQASENLNRRIAEILKRSQWLELKPEIRGVQFLRGVSSRASYVLPAFYTHLGALVSSDDRRNPYHQRVHTEYARFSSLTTISLACRAVFDDDPKGLTAKSFAKATPQVLKFVAAYWGQKSGQSTEEAARALTFLQQVFRHCALQPKDLFKQPSLLARRVGLLTYHADHEAAHISLDPYLFHIVDLIHVVAAITVIGAIIVDFDDANRRNTYFDSIDQAAWDAAKATFPKLPGKRLFEGFKIHEQGSLYWKIEELDGLNMLLNGLPTAIGYPDSTADAGID